MHRIVILLLGVCAIGGLQGWLCYQQPITEHIASGLLGEYWYRIELDQKHVGFMTNQGWRDSLGHWHYESTTHFLLEDNTPNTINKHLVFDARAPHDLLKATYSAQSGQQRRGTEVTKHHPGYIAQLTQRAQSSNTTLDWTYRLGDFVGFESWLAQQQPSADQSHPTHSPDFEKLRISLRSYRTVETNSTGYVVETNAPYSATQTQLDSKYRPVHMRMAGLFDVTLTHRADAIALDRLRRKTDYLFDVDQRLLDHTSIASLHLRISADRDVHLPEELFLSANPLLGDANPDDARGEELRYPISNPRIQQLVAEALSSASTSSKTAVSQLVNLAHQQLRYVENHPTGSVLAALTAGEGECTDYADLFTTLARAAGYAARTVYGLAYKDNTRPTFMFHAWNEIHVDSRWQAVDPTWNQVRVDATHIPLTATQAAHLMLANNTGEVTFSVVDASYF